MKTCLICTAAGQADDTATCPLCGEASWSEKRTDSSAGKQTGKLVEPAVDKPHKKAK